MPRFKRTADMPYRHQRSEGLRGNRGGKQTCDYCERYLRKPHVIRMAGVSSVICSACIKKGEQRYQAMVDEEGGPLGEGVSTLTARPRNGAVS
jgi:hypothetical protein